MHKCTSQSVADKIWVDSPNKKKGKRYDELGWFTQISVDLAKSLKEKNKWKVATEYFLLILLNYP